MHADTSYTCRALLLSTYNVPFSQVEKVFGFLNFFSRFPVPLSLEVIQSRLENNYYRSLEALKHDTTVMLSNAESFFGKNAKMSEKIERLSDWFTRTLSL